jgi:hypothetical protein
MQILHTRAHKEWVSGGDGGAGWGTRRWKLILFYLGNRFSKHATFQSGQKDQRLWMCKGNLPLLKVTGPASPLQTDGWMDGWMGGWLLSGLVNVILQTRSPHDVVACCIITVRSATSFVRISWILQLLLRTVLNRHSPLAKMHRFLRNIGTPETSWRRKRKYMNSNYLRSKISNLLHERVNKTSMN